MKNKLSLLMIILFSLFLFAGCGSGDSSSAAEGQANDGTDNEAEEAASEESQETDGDIIATTVAIVETMDELELDLVGVPTSYKDLPERYDGVTEIGMAMEPDMEIILSLKPTEVLTVTTLADYVQDSFSEADVPATYMNLDSVDNMYEEIEALGEKYNREDHAAELVAEFEEKLAEVEAKIEGLESPKVLILLGVPGSYLVATENSYVGDLVRRAGGTNVFPGEDGIEYTAANTEHLQQTDPDIILRAAHGMPDEVVEMFEEEFKENDIWQHFEAVQNDQVYDLEETLFGTTANIRAPEALDTLVDILYPHIN